MLSPCFIVCLPLPSLFYFIHTIHLCSLVAPGVFSLLLIVGFGKLGFELEDNEVGLHLAANPRGWLVDHALWSIPSLLCTTSFSITLLPSTAAPTVPALTQVHTSPTKTKLGAFGWGSKQLGGLYANWQGNIACFYYYCITENGKNRIDRYCNISSNNSITFITFNH